MGLIEVNRPDMPLMRLYQAADTACYTAKSLGRDRLHWYKEDDQDVQGHQRDVIAINQVRSALGKASFDYLKRLPFDIIKIDGSFITSIVDDPMDETMVNFMVKLANLRGQLTVAEFVENEAIVERLKANGVHYAQGYHFGQPKPFSELLVKASEFLSSPSS